MKQKYPKLKKNPDIDNYVVESIDRGPGHDNRGYFYSKTSKEALAYAKKQPVHTRIFKVSFKLVREMKVK